MTLYTFFGSLNTLFIIISLLGIYSQLKTIWGRKSASAKEGTATELLSINQFTVSFMAYYSFFTYGYSIEPFNHFIVWPRLIASLLVSFILYEIWKDRRTKVSRNCLLSTLALMIVGMLGLVMGNSYQDEGKLISSSLIIVVTLLIAQGYFHQIRLIWRSGKTGAVDLKMSQFILMMDVTTIAFALSMGLSTGWPLLVLAVTSAITKLAMMYLFRWVRLSGRAVKRRQQYAS